jgi:hypothetical protein
MFARSGRDEPLGEPVIAGLKISRIVGHRHRGPSECPRAHALYLENFWLTFILGAFIVGFEVWSAP